MPHSEYCLHKEYWKATRWGLDTDVLALIASQVMATRTESKPLDPWRIKELATSKGFANKFMTMAIKPASVLRRAFMSVVDTVREVLSV